MRVRTCVFSLCFVAVSMVQQTAYAAEVQPTTALDIVPITVTAIQATKPTAPKSLDGFELIELYNSSSAPFDISQLHLFIADAQQKEISFASLVEPGYLEPKKHVVLSRLIDNVPTIKHASFGIAQANKGSFIYDKAVLLVMTADGYRSRKIDITKLIDGTLMKRGLGVDGYLDSFVAGIDETTANYPVDRALTTSVFDDGLYAPADAPAGLKIVEIYPYASDCDPFDMEHVECGDFVKLTNSASKPIALDEYVLRTDSGSAARSSSNTFSIVKPRDATNILQPGEYVTVRMTDDGRKLSLTNSGGYVWIEDVWGLASYHAGLTQYLSAGASQQGLGYALGEDNAWHWTTDLSADGPNHIVAPVEPAVVCADGKYLNPDTNRCRTIADAVNALAMCEEGYERNPVTNRCRKLASLASSSLTPCGEGQERNPTTNRCRSIASAVAELLPCDEGYERNPQTNRCRKIKTTDMPAAAYPVKSTGASATTVAMWWGVGGVGVVALAYAGWEWHTEIGRSLRRLVTLIHK